MIHRSSDKVSMKKGKRKKKGRKKAGGMLGLSIRRQGILPPARPFFDRLFRFGLGATCLPGRLAEWSGRLWVQLASDRQLQLQLTWEDW